MANEDKQAFSVAEFCDRYGIRRNSAYLEIKAGRLLIRKAGRKTIIRKVDADAWLDALPIGDTSSGNVLAKGQTYQAAKPTFEQLMDSMAGSS